ncbi:site-specific integrase [Ensifer adhaerens]|uniref:site-specific integrase n=1 Tax=Ensifer adhaerens TaxID=106592 RepID=UPI001C4DDE7D|nr:site-specific integrase [Ensifer adhaerens]MBW0369995.1 site-specific integrase [Ensifer adhaerens]UCM19067.1 site-specific integrase [Ensifer adhaerens]
MAIASYLMRRGGRYSFQIRYSVRLAAIMRKPLYRASLMTADYSVARFRLAEYLHWFLPMNIAQNPSGLRDQIKRQIEEYLEDPVPIDPDRLAAREKFDEWQIGALTAATELEQSYYCFDDDLIEKVAVFQRQNAEADKYNRKRNLIAAYEKGRSDVQEAIAYQVVPSSFKLPLEVSPLQTAVGKPKGGDVRTSEALAMFLRHHEVAGKNADARSDIALIVQFIIDELDDPLVGELHGNLIKELDKMLPDIPNRTGIPKESQGSLSSRFQYAKSHGWENLQRLTEARLRNGYHNALSKFFVWLIDKKLYAYDKPVFSYISDENLVSLSRDAFTNDEVMKIVRQPLFTGCHGKDRIWKPGAYLVQSHLYWAYILLLLTGLRPGELGRLELSDFKERDSIWYLHLQGFDPSKGRVARKDVRIFKTKSSERNVPLHPVILDLGFLDRLAELEKAGCKYVFPEWEPYVKPNGALRWGQPITKSWQYLKQAVGITRKDVTVYSCRHYFAQLIDNTDITDRARKRLMGHSVKDDVPSRYGSKTRLTVRDLRAIAALNDPTVDAVCDLLLDARSRVDNGELTLLEPWKNRATWSNHYREKMDG